jgi:hypothetical protein
MQGRHKSNTIDVIKHEPTCFKIAPRLHPFHQITTTTISLYRHLEEEHFFVDIRLGKLLS